MEDKNKKEIKQEVDKVISEKRKEGFKIPTRTAVLIIVFVVVAGLAAVFWEERVVEVRRRAELEQQYLLEEQKKNLAISENNKPVAKMPKTEEELKLAEKRKEAQEQKNEEHKKLESLEAETVSNGQVEWEEPVDMGDLGMTSKDAYAGHSDDNNTVFCKGRYEGDNTSYGSDGVKYVKVGKVISGNYKNGDVYVVSSGISQGPLWGREFIRGIKKGGEFYLSLGDSKYRIDYISDLLDDCFMENSDIQVIKKKFLFEELEYPEEITGDNEREIFSKSSSNVFFSNKGFQVAFVHSKFGKVWFSESGEYTGADLELNSRRDYQGNKYYGHLRGGGFYIRRPDGTAETYEFKPDIFGKETTRSGNLMATWSDGSRNEDNYEYYPSSCGGGAFHYFASEVSFKNDCVVAGTTDKGDKLYIRKNPSDSDLIKLKDESSISKDISMEEYLSTRPEILWKDPFGRILVFYNMKYRGMAECAKPVVYLYPKSSQNVDVRVSPGRGITFSDPEYKNGWKVFAKPNGELTDISDGEKYPYLFWEGQGDLDYKTPQQGFVVPIDELNGFFDDKLVQLGMIDQEIRDFKEFWIPKMKEENKPYYFVTFLSQMFIDMLAPIEVEPNPDTIIRVLMDYEGLDEYKNVPEPKLFGKERLGFTVVEWGGMSKGYVK